MNLEMRLNDILIACKIADWYSIDITVDYDLDLSLGILYADGKIIFYNNSILEFTESITPVNELDEDSFLRSIEEASLVVNYYK